MANLFALSLLLLTFSLPFLIFATEYTAPSSAVEMLRGTADPKFKRATEHIMFQFPKDHGAHPEYKTEWWYYNIHLSTGGQERYALHFVTFLVTEGESGRVLYVSQAAFGDAQSGSYVTGERVAASDRRGKSRP